MDAGNNVSGFTPVALANSKPSVISTMYLMTSSVIDVGAVSTKMLRENKPIGFGALIHADESNAVIVCESFTYDTELTANTRELMRK